MWCFTLFNFCPCVARSNELSVTHTSVHLKTWEIHSLHSIGNKCSFVSHQTWIQKWVKLFYMTNTTQMKLLKTYSTFYSICIINFLIWHMHKYDIKMHNGISKWNYNTTLCENKIIILTLSFNTFCLISVLDLYLIMYISGKAVTYVYVVTVMYVFCWYIIHLCS